MTLSRTNLVLAILLACTIVLALMSNVDLSQPNIEILPDMKYSPAYGAYASNPNFPNGRTLQPPVPGTIARGQLPLHYEATPEDAIRAGKELENPLLQLDEPQRQAATRRGSEIFGILCTGCHGRSGKGDGLVPKYGFPPPPSLLTGKSGQMKDGQLFHILTYGQGSMPTFAAQLTPVRRWQVILLIRSLQQQAKTETEGAAAVAGHEGESPPAAAGQTDSAGQTPKPEIMPEETASDTQTAAPSGIPTLKAPQESEVEADQAGASPSAEDTDSGTTPAPQSQSDQP